MILFEANKVGVIYYVAIDNYQADMDTDPSYFTSEVTKLSKPTSVLDNPSSDLSLVPRTPVNQPSPSPAPWSLVDAFTHQTLGTKFLHDTDILSSALQES
jgi:hypothetical protein